MSAKWGVFFYGVIAVMVVVLYIATHEIDKIKERLDKCCPVKTEEVKADVQPNDTHVLQSNVERRERLVQTAKRNKFLRGMDPQDASIWISLVPFAELDEHCNALPECTQDQMHMARPIIVQTRGEYGEGYVAVLGLDVYAPQGHSVIPSMTYYVGTQGGGLWRFQTGKALVEVRHLDTNEWVSIEPTQSDQMRDDVRTAFVYELGKRNKTQEL